MRKDERIKKIKKIDNLLNELSFMLENDCIVLLTDDNGVYVHIKSTNEDEIDEVRQIEKELSEYTEELHKLFNSNKVFIDNLPSEIDKYRAENEIMQATPVRDENKYYLKLLNMQVYLKITEDQYKRCLREGNESIIDELKISHGSAELFNSINTLITLYYGEESSSENR